MNVVLWLSVVAVFADSGFAQITTSEIPDFSINSGEEFASSTASSPLSPDGISTVGSSTGTITENDEEDEEGFTIEMTALECATEIPQVIEFNAIAENFNITLSWAPPDDPECVEQYTIFLNNGEYGNTTELTFTVDNLNACTEYTVGVAVFDGTTNGNLSSKTLKTTTPSPPFVHSVENLIINPLENNLNVTWEPPSETVLQCVTAYSLTWWDEDNSKTNQRTIKAPTTYYDEMPLVGCLRYGIQIIPKVGEAMDGIPKMINYTAPPTEPSAPTLITTDVHKTSASVTWEIEAKSINKCPLEQIVATCNAPHSTNSNYSWIIWDAEEVLLITNETSSNRYYMTITELSYFTNYTCMGVVKNTWGNSAGTKFDFLTNEEVPPPPDPIKITHRDPRRFTVEWTEPKEIPGIMTEYVLMIESEGPLYPEVDQCSNVTSINISVDPTVTSHEFENAIPCYNYTVSVYGVDGAGDGIAATENTTTLSLTPPTPRFPDNGLECDKTSANVTIQIENDQSEYACSLLHIFVTCVAPNDTNSNYSWIKWRAEEDFPITDVASDIQYRITMEDLSPFTNYTCNAVVQNTCGNSSEEPFSFSTQEDVPPKPESIRIINIEARKFSIEWTKPKEIPGNMTGYSLSITNDGPQYSEMGDCSDSNVTELVNVSINPEITSYDFQDALPYYKYNVSLYAVDGAGGGEAAEADVITPSLDPDPVRIFSISSLTYSTNETYEAKLTVQFEPPCNLYGPFQQYLITYSGKRNNFPIHNGSITIENPKELTANIELFPERNYSIDVRVITENFTSTAVPLALLQSEPGVPSITNNMTAPKVQDKIKASFTLSKSSFDNTNGDIMAYALILLTSKVKEAGYGFWDGSNETWPNITAKNAVQLTNNLWNPFEGGNETIHLIIGENDQKYTTISCEPLEEDTDYWLMVRALTSRTYKDGSLLHFKTEMWGSSSLGLILGLTFGLLALLILTIFIIFLWRRKRKAVIEDGEKGQSTSAPASICVKKFPEYYASIKENYNLLKQQYSDLNNQSKNVALPVTFATLLENRRKNRYTNILPYDETRVTLNIDEDDEISSDYINASYIKGYSGKIEYIATQGPLESTTRDFWKMILQENVSIIAMVSQFVEQNKEKCYQYFPNNHESVNFGDQLEVKCSTELHFGTYCIRTLQIRKGTEQRNVIHMQFLEWPDFGVPQGTDNLLQFCSQLREKANTEGGLIVVHCSAGVGRTGTLIALDILLQTIGDHRDINIFNTVFDLRTQRINMVQTEKQYMFIHTSVNEYIETPMNHSNDSGQERIYENLDVLKGSLEKNLIETEVESAL